MPASPAATIRRRLTKPDGRSVWLYAAEPIPEGIEAPAPRGGPVVATPELRWHPLRAEWVDYAANRQERTFLPPAGYDPLAPTEPGGEPTELPAGPWEVAVFENRFPSLAPGAPEPPGTLVPTRPGRGACEVVVYTQAAKGGLGDLELSRVEMLIDVWADRTRELGARPEIEYVMPFENRGVEVGATLQHPHGQIYAYPFVPPIPARELEEERRHRARSGRGLLETHLEAELADGRRILFDEEGVVAFVPVFARYPYEVWVAPRAPVPGLPDVDAPLRAAFARALRAVVRGYDALRGRPFPYVMVFHQAPTDGAAHPEAHLHVEFYPPYRTTERLKYLAGTEIGAGMFTNDALPEAKAAELQAALSAAGELR
ncbi:MAG TPA: galactose-1-phosphate uridylyltransferase [Candidatus Binatia bacterium]|nr:galactose-1-phosphate uridylyltransferase [Candidatus Binatia bacterium]